LISSGLLLSVKRRALRRRVWFSALSSVERGLVDSVIRAFDVVRSRRLTLMLVRIVGKLCEALESWFLRMVDTVGWELVRVRCLWAASLGCRDAHLWLRDRGFAVYLTVLRLNTPAAYRV
jgi:hypothetical protein